MPPARVKVVKLKVDVSSDHRQEAKVWGAPEPLVLEMAPMSKPRAAWVGVWGMSRSPPVGMGADGLATDGCREEVRVPPSSGPDSQGKGQR